MKFCIPLLALSVITPLSVFAAQDDDLEEVVVEAHPLSSEGLSQAVEILEGKELLKDTQVSIGDTLANLPGIHSSSFGPASGRPVIHGLSGARVRVMEDRIDTLDASVTSPDHAVTVESFIANRIEVLKGPATLLYGSGAIGGVVDVHTGRIPHEIPATPASGRVELRGNDNGDQTNAAGRIDGGAGAFAWHVDGFTREADPYEIPGFAESAVQRASEEEEGGEEEEEEAFGVLPGSQFESDGGAFGVSYIGASGFVGVALSVLDSNYGLPGGHEHEHEEGEEEEEEEEGNPTLDMEQTRVDVEVGWSDPIPGFESINFRAAVNDYEHVEIEPNGEVATKFTNEAVETRLELVYADAGQWAGAIGAQFIDRDFSATGEEAFVPPVDTRSLGLFWLGERPLGDYDLETGFRVEWVEQNPSSGSSRDFFAPSASVGLVRDFGTGWRLGLLGDYSTRAPVAEELYSDGPHLATSSFELGNPQLDEESALNLAATLDYSNQSVEWVATAYLTRFNDFIYERATGEEEDGLPVLEYTQGDANVFGIDARARFAVAETNIGRLFLTGDFDTVVAELDKSGNNKLPRTPPTRVGIGLELSGQRIDASINYRLVNSVERDKVADLELPTDGYEDLRFYVGTTLALGERSLQLFVQGRNLTDDEQRNHTSFIKDFAPLPGRTLEAGLRLEF